VPKLSHAIKNKWSAGWTKSWFYCRVPYVHNSRGRKSIYVLHSQMSALDYMVKPEVECPDDDSNDAAFIQATATIEGQDVVEEFIACKIFPLASSFGFTDVTVGTTPVSKIRTPLLVFPMEPVSTGDASHILAEVETEAKRFLGSFGPRELDFLMMAKLPNGRHLNHVLEQMGVPYVPCPLLDSEASQAARDKRKARVFKKLAAKRAKTGTSRANSSKMVPPPPKMGPLKKIGIVKMVRPRARTGPQGMSEIELALAMLVEVSKKFWLLDVAVLSHGLHTASRPSTILAVTRCLMFARPLT
jgi:hypothetical protein